MSAVLEPATELLTLEQCLVKHERPKPTIDQNGNPILYTGPAYKFDPKRKTSPGSFLRIKPDGTVIYSNPSCLKYAAPGSKPFKMPALNPRTEGTAETFERLKAAIEKRANVKGYKHRDYARFTGKPAFPGWKIAATDGFTALIERGEGEGEAMPMFDRIQTHNHIVCSIDNPEFHLALKRARIMTGDNSAKVRFIGNPGELRLTSADPNVGDFEETVPINCADSWHVALDANFLESMCGAWPLAVWYHDDENPVMFEPFDSSWRFVVCPIKDVWTDVEGIPAEPVSTEENSEPQTEEIQTWKDTEMEFALPEGTIEELLEIPNPLDQAEPEPVADPPANVESVEIPIEPEPVKPVEPVKVEQRIVRMIIGEAIDETSARLVVERMNAHILGAPSYVTHSSVLKEVEGNMVVMTLEFMTRIDAMQYHSHTWYRHFVEQTEHLLLGNYVVKLFENRTAPVPTPTTPEPNGTDQAAEPSKGNKITCPQCGSTDTSFYDGALGYEAVRCNSCNEETDLNNDHNHCPRPDRIRAHVEAEKERVNAGNLPADPPAPCVHDWDDMTLAELPVCTKCNSTMPEELIPRLKCLAISRNVHTWVTHYDHILARNEQHGLELIRRLRPDCIAVSVFTAAELLDSANRLNQETTSDVQFHMETIKTEAQS